MSAANPPSKVAVRFLVGTDDYSSLATLNQWKRAFVKKYNDASLLSIDLAGSPEKVTRDVQEAAQTQSLFATAKLVVLRNVFEATDERLTAAIVELWQQARAGELVVLNWQRGEPDKRRLLYKQSQKLFKERRAIWEQFTEPKDYQRANWLSEYAKKQQLNITSDAAELLLRNTAELPLWSLANAVSLLETATAGQIDRVAVLTYVPEYATVKNFGVTDLLVARQKRAALTAMAPLTLSRRVDVGEAISLFGAITWSIRSLLLLKSLQEEGVSRQDLGRASKLPPLAIQKFSRHLAQYTISDLKQLLIRAAALDQAVKRGDRELVWAIDELALSF